MLQLPLSNLISGLIVISTQANTKEMLDRQMYIKEVFGNQYDNELRATVKYEKMEVKHEISNTTSTQLSQIFTQGLGNV